MTFASERKITFILLLALSSLLGCERSITKIGRDPVVKVNDSVLSATEFSELLAGRLKAFNILSARDSAVVAQAKNSIVQDFIVQSVTKAWAHQNQIFVRKEDLDAEIAKTRSSYPDDLSFRTALANEGLHYEKWQDRVHYLALERLVLAKLRGEIKRPSADELRAFYNNNKSLFQRPAQIKLRQIFLDTEIAADRVKGELAKGKSFSALAKEYSRGPEAPTGGELGWVDKGTLPVFDDAFRLRSGQRSGVLKSPYGFHIIEVLDKRAEKTLSYDESADRVEKMILERAEQELYSSWLEEQILKAKVYKNDSLLKSIQVYTRSE